MEFTYKILKNKRFCPVINHRVGLYESERSNASQSLLGNFYLEGSLESGNVWDKDEDIKIDNLRLGGSVFIGYETLFGPFYLGFGHADGGNN